MKSNHCCVASFLRIFHLDLPHFFFGSNVSHSCRCFQGYIDIRNVCLRNVTISQRLMPA
ncbi:hypothetical protein NC652_037161 [Populus alba x Populus x berolinensis]|uniref:Uncharacterized protein n=1 Tax=Populus alba x Populus x berolinensis TaxID=444605 RepID=A0AAD6PVL2_9ROSI|nr:hypothetical protein NC652_037103 [Populus alba x Populus x berolinensis]KAJ6871714.1 hypothetical protein NC652_037159 [Populus alba x Populus x berolinensis]KAJ6871716.1 hypothetical protein NC652_037161 [Populus alba x Populus x berolinensis]KAJ6969194.1 hypothetical protein NC653_036995 [Populus alba x Populus x berolinensis]KAJ6969201.1 hypothetical protein NC653_037000 [Populus alba x Populus x berolinensis]